MFFKKKRPQIKAEPPIGTEAEIAASPETPTLPQVAPEGEALFGDSGCSLGQGIKAFRFGSEASGVVGTDAAMGKTPNEDAALVVPRSSFAAVFDGVGGMGGGDRVVRLLAEGFLRFPENFHRALETARDRFNSFPFEESLKLFGSGSCFYSTRLVRNGDRRYLELCQSGDCRLLIFRAGGEILQSEDESYVNDMVKRGLINGDEALFSSFRGRVNRCIYLGREEAVTVNPLLSMNGKRLESRGPVEVFKGDRVVLMSDGIADNLTAGEVHRLIAGTSPTEAALALTAETDRRMKHKNHIIDETLRAYLAESEQIEDERILAKMMAKIRQPEGNYQWLAPFIFEKARIHAGVFSDGYKTKPSRDNRALIIFDLL